MKPSEGTSAYNVWIMAQALPEYTYTQVANALDLHPSYVRACGQRYGITFAKGNRGRKRHVD